MTDDEIVTKWAVELKSFKVFCKNCHNLTDEEVDQLGEEPYTDLRFEEVALGFFLAKGVPPIYAFKLADLSGNYYHFWQ